MIFGEFDFRMSLRNLEKHLIFVYGTLKSGEPNNYLLKDPKNGFAESIGKGETISRYPLIIASKFNIPFLLDKPDVGNVMKKMKNRVIRF